MGTEESYFYYCVGMFVENMNRRVLLMLLMLVEIFAKRQKILIFGIYFCEFSQNARKFLPLKYTINN